ncbi:cupin domain-containing protein [Bacteroidota bacterium]
MNSINNFIILIICPLFLVAAKSIHQPFKMNTINNLNPDAEVISEILKDDGTFPNNEKLPLLIYKQAIKLGKHEPAATVEKYFHGNHWGGSWRNGIYGFHHYHSTAHEVLGVYSGEVKVQFGGPKGIMVNAKAGDVIIIPAGVAHKNLGSSPDFGVVGAYPPGQRWDMNHGKAGERPKADENINKVPLPETDPVFGKPGPLDALWKTE